MNEEERKNEERRELQCAFEEFRNSGKLMTKLPDGPELKVYLHERVTVQFSAKPQRFKQLNNSCGIECLDSLRQHYSPNLF